MDVGMRNRILLVLIIGGGYWFFTPIEDQSNWLDNNKKLQSSNRVWDFLEEKGFPKIADLEATFEKAFEVLKEEDLELATSIHKNLCDLVMELEKLAKNHPDELEAKITMLALTRGYVIYYEFSKFPRKTQIKVGKLGFDLLKQIYDAGLGMIREQIQKVDENINAELADDEDVQKEL